MSKRVKNLITQELSRRFEGIESCAVINPRGIDATKNNNIRRKLREKGLRMTVVKNTLAKRAVSTDGDHGLKGFEPLLDGPSAVIYGEASAAVIARLLLDEKKVIETLELRGIFFDGDVYAGEQGVEQVSKMPTREEAIAQVLQAILSPGQNLAGALAGPGSALASILSSIEDKAKVAEGAAA